MRIADVAIAVAVLAVVLAGVGEALTDGLARVTAGIVDQQHAARAAAAIQRGEPLTVALLTASPA